MQTWTFRLLKKVKKVSLGFIISAWKFESLSCWNLCSLVPFRKVLSSRKKNGSEWKGFYRSLFYSVRTFSRHEFWKFFNKVISHSLKTFYSELFFFGWSWSLESFSARLKVKSWSFREELFFPVSTLKIFRLDLLLPVETKTKFSCTKFDLNCFLHPKFSAKVKFRTSKFAKLSFQLISPVETFLVKEEVQSWKFKVEFIISVETFYAGVKLKVQYLKSLLEFLLSKLFSSRQVRTFVGTWNG